MSYSTLHPCSLGAGLLNIAREESLSNGNVPNVNRGNTRLTTNGIPAVNFNPLVVDASLTCKLDHFPGYQGEFPIKFAGEYMNNLAISRQNQGVSGGVAFGKAGKKGLWEVSYQYRYWGANMGYEELVDDDFGGFYQNTAGLNFGGAGSEYGGGNNVNGHVVRAGHSPYDSLTFSIVWYHAQLINKFPGSSDSDTDRILLDAMWKF